MVELLIENGSNVNEVNNEEITPLFAAVENGKGVCFQLSQRE